MSTIPLAKGYKPEKLSFPVYVSRKYDGVPVKMTMHPEWGWTVETRQGKAVPSVEGLMHSLYKEYLRLGVGHQISIIGEIILKDNPDAAFKDVSGVVRRQYNQKDLLTMVVFECSDEVGDTFHERYTWMQSFFTVVSKKIDVSLIYQYPLKTVNGVSAITTRLLGENPNWEGLVARSHDDRYLPGKRSWGYQKILAEPTIDLNIVGCEEAVSKDGEPKGMAGRLIASYKGTEIGIGPGKLTHAERVGVLQMFGRGRVHTRMAQIKYKKDDSYDALRQPTFQCWRDDKDTPDA